MYGDQDELRVSFQISIPSQNTSEGGSSSDSNDTVIDTIDCSSVESGISLANSFVSKKLNLAHCKAIVISEEIAESGVAEIVYTLTNNIDVRPDCNVIISRSTAYDFLSNSKSEIESITAKYYEIIASSSRYTGYTSNITLSDVFNGIDDTFGEASAILGSVTESNKSVQDLSINNDTISGETTANLGDSSQASSKIDVVGLAVFKNDRLVRRINCY